jgi:hypothetical protein
LSGRKALGLKQVYLFFPCNGDGLVNPSRKDSFPVSAKRWLPADWFSWSRLHACGNRVPLSTNDYSRLCAVGGSCRHMPLSTCILYLFEGVGLTVFTGLESTLQAVCDVA